MQQSARVELVESDDEKAPVEETAEERASRELNTQDENGEGVDVAACERLKQRGNALFGANHTQEALHLYQKAQRRAPIKPLPPPPANVPRRDPPEKDGSAEEKQEKPPQEEHLDPEKYTLTAQVFCNAALCLMKLERVAEAERDLSEAIRHLPTYQKAYLRRAECNFNLEKWSAAVADWDEACKLGATLDADSLRKREVAKKKAEEEMQKMMGQLKGLANTFLNKFGLSTDNFKFDKNSEGGYSMRFEQQK